MSRRIVFTGAPGSGKTTVGQYLAARFAGRLALVPEAATFVYASRNTRWDLLDEAGQREVQIEIFHHQIAQEEQASRDHPDKFILCDRGTIDGSAYWPGGPDDYWKTLGSSLAQQYARYDRVLLLETAARLGIYDGPASNPVRFESQAQALQNQDLLERLWRGHPSFQIIPATTNVREKCDAMSQLIEQML